MYTDIYGNVNQQKAIVTVMKELLEIRNKILKDDPTSGTEHWTQAPHGAIQAHHDDNNICSVCIGN